MGTVYASQAAIELLVATNEVLQDELSFLNLTSHVAYDAIFNKLSSVPYSSIYNICNTRVSATDIITRIVGSNHINHQELSDVITGNNSSIIYQTEIPIEGIKNDFIKVTMQSEYDLIKESDFQLFWADEREDFSEEKSYIFKGRA